MEAQRAKAEDCWGERPLLVTLGADKQQVCLEEEGRVDTWRAGVLAIEWMAGQGGSYLGIGQYRC